MIMLLWILLIVLALCVVLALFLWNFPWILRYYTLKIFKYDIKLDNKAIFISDLHVNVNDACDGRFLRVLGEFIVNENVKRLVIAGDFVNFVHKSISRDRLEKMIAQAVRTIGIPKNYYIEIFYVTSTTSHDPKVSEMINFSVDNAEVFVIPGALILEVNGRTKFCVVHGDYVSRNGFLSSILNRIAAIFGRKLYLERKLKSVIGLDAETWLIMGHTHMPGVDPANRVANCGSWGSHFARYATRTLILMDRRSLKLLKNLGNGSWATIYKTRIVID
ncbi:MAG: hypothetical protein ACTSXJ_04370 [Candidatus Baldrarchaeia archaeon]